MKLFSVLIPNMLYFFRVAAIMVNARQEIISANISGDLVG